jgi:hypothetical protein
MRNTADVTGGKPIAVLLQSITRVSANNPLVAFYDIHGGKREVLLFYFVPATTRNDKSNTFKNFGKYFIIIIISPPQSTAGHRPLQLLAISLDLRLLASSSHNYVFTSG